MSQARDVRDYRDERDVALDSHSGPTGRREARRVTDKGLSHRCPPPPFLSTFLSFLLPFSFFLLPFFSAFAEETGEYTTVSCAAGDGFIAVNDGGACVSTNFYLAAGETVTLRTYPASGKAFDHWDGGPASLNTRAEIATLTGDGAARNISAVFHDALFVSTTGSDETGDGTAASPFKTIQHAVDQSSSVSWVHVAGGIYEEAVTSAKAGMHIIGSYLDDFSARDLKNHRTVIKAPNATSACFKPTALTNELWGVDLTGGQYGAQNGCTTGSLVTHRLVQCVISNNTYGAWCGGYKPNFSAYNCLFYKNTYGSYITGDNGAQVYLYNCTFASNTTDAVYRQHAYGSAHHLKNCVFVGNGRAINLNSGSSNYCNIYRNLYYGNTDCFRSTRTYVDQTSVYANGMFMFRSAQIFEDAFLGEDFIPQTGSYAAKAGENLSTSVYCLADLYGNDWNGAYDLGCCRTAATSPCRAESVMYLSPDGDDANTGADADHPMKTPAKAFVHLADGATVHIANGTYVGMADIGANNVKVIGESRDGVIFQAHESEIPSYNFDHALGLFGQYPSVSNLTFTTSHAGLFASDCTINYNVDVDNCYFTGCHFGLYDGVLQGRNSSRRLRVSHSIFRDNTVAGVIIGNTIVADNCLFADNGYYGIDGNTWDTSYKPRVNHCTFINNGSYAFIERNGTRPNSYIANSIFYGNGNTRSTAAFKGGNKMYLYSCAFYNNYAAYAKSSGDPIFYDKRETDPTLNLTDLLKGHLLEGSPCAQSGTNLNANTNFKGVCEVTDDLDYISRNLEKLDLGCYISPETMKELAGHGYHVLTVTGDPEGWGEPSVSYGDNLLKDESRGYSAAEGIVTYALDGVRAYPLSDGIRAAYQGYEYTLEGESEPLYASATDETLAAFAFEANATWTIKWERQYLITVSTDALGCKVKIDDGTAGTTVTKWIPEGASYTVEFIPTADFQFDGWGAGFPSEGDARVIATTVTACSGTVTFSPNYKSILCVSKSGSDDDGDGTAANPFLTIARATSVAKSGDVIRIGTGLFEESVTNTTLHELTIEGGYGDGWVRDLKNSPTIIKPANNKLPCIYINNVMSNVVKGLVLTGGSIGIVAYGPAGRSDNNGGKALCALRNHHLMSLVVTNNTGVGVEAYKQQYAGVRVISSLIADNGGIGVRFGGDTTAACYVHNCTIVSNKANGVYVASGYTEYEIRNSIVMGNKDIDVKVDNTSNSMATGNDCFYRDDASKNVTYSGPAWYLIGGCIFRDPQLNADYSLKAASPCVATGDDLTDYAYCSELEDLYGTAWNGVYDIGAIKSSAVRTRSADVYVEEGDDLQAAVLNCAENGTVHVAAGEYAGPVAVMMPGVKIVGAGAGKTIIRGVATATTDLKSMSVVHLAAEGASVEDCTLTGATCGAGLRFGASDYSKNCTAKNCTISGNQFGMRYYAVRGSVLEPDKVSKTSAHHRLTYCKLVDNTSWGIHVDGGAYCSLIADNCLIARNGNGVYMWEGSGSGFWVYEYFYYCTVADNVGVGVQARDGDSALIKFYNGVITGNGTGIQHASYGPMELYYTVLAGNTTEMTGDSYTFSNCDQTTAPTFRSRTGDHAYWPLEGSSAVGRARRLVAQDPLNPSAAYDLVDEPATDLAGNVRKYWIARLRVAGCYTLPPRGAMIILR